MPASVYSLTTRKVDGEPMWFPQIICEYVRCHATHVFQRIKPMPRSPHDGFLPDTLKSLEQRASDAAERNRLYDEGREAALPNGWVEINLGYGRPRPFCSANHAILYLKGRERIDKKNAADLKAAEARYNT